MNYNLSSAAFTSENGVTYISELPSIKIEFSDLFQPVPVINCKVSGVFKLLFIAATHVIRDLH